jgi:hypothetical protein
MQINLFLQTVPILNKSMVIRLSQRDPGSTVILGTMFGDGKETKKDYYAQA